MLALIAAVGRTIVRLADVWQRHGNQSQYQPQRSSHEAGGCAEMLSCADLQPNILVEAQPVPGWK